MMKYLLFVLILIQVCFSDLKVRVVTVQADTSGSQDITISGFGTPKAAQFFVTKSRDIGILSDTASISNGVTDGTNEGSISVGSNGSANPSVCYRAADDGTVFKLYSGNQYLMGATFNSFITDGIRIDWDAAAHQGYNDFYITVVLYTGSSLSAYADTMDAAGGTKTIGFLPELTFLSGNGAALGAASVWIYNYGISDTNVNLESNNVFSYCFFESNNQATTDLSASLYDVSAHQENSTSVAWRSAITTYTSTTFDIDNTFGSSSGDDLIFLSLNIDGIEHYIDTILLPSGTGDWSVTKIGFQPQIVMMVVTGSSALNTSVGDSSAGIIGYYIFDKDSSEHYQGISSEDGVSGGIKKSVYDTTLNMTLQGDNVCYNATFKTMDSNGFTLNFTAVDGDVQRIAYLVAIKDTVEAGSPCSTMVPHDTSAICTIGVDVSLILTSDSTDSVIPITILPDSLEYDTVTLTLSGPLVHFSNDTDTVLFRTVNGCPDSLDTLMVRLFQFWDSTKITAVIPDIADSGVVDTVCVKGRFPYDSLLHAIVGSDTLDTYGATIDSFFMITKATMDTGCYDVIVADSVTSDTLTDGLCIYDISVPVNVANNFWRSLWKWKVFTIW